MRAELIDKMGTDLTVVNAARVSFDNESDWEDDETITDPSGAFKLVYSKKLGERDKKLINYLAKHNHWTPFSHVVVTMRETVPIFVARQRFKHMVGFSYNEVSRRYVDDEPEFYVPEVWRGKPENAKQGSSNTEIKIITYPNAYGEGLDEGIPISEEYDALIKTCAAMYEVFIKNGVAPEQARMVLPQSMYTSYYVTGSLAAWARAYKLRIDPHAQKEIQDLAKMWGEVFNTLPELQHSWTALTNTQE